GAGAVRTSAGRRYALAVAGTVRRARRGGGRVRGAQAVVRVQVAQCRAIVAGEGSPDFAPAAHHHVIVARGVLVDRDGIESHGPTLRVVGKTKAAAGCIAEI